MTHNFRKPYFGLAFIPEDIGVKSGTVPSLSNMVFCISNFNKTIRSSFFALLLYNIYFFIEQVGKQVMWFLNGKATSLNLVKLICNLFWSIKHDRNFHTTLGKFILTTWLFFLKMIVKSTKFSCQYISILWVCFAINKWW